MADRRESRSDILSAVVTVLSTRGADQLSIRTVAAEAGVSVGAVQHHFPTKQALLTGAMARVEERFRLRLQARFEQEPSPEARLRVFCEAIACVEDADVADAVVWTAFASRAGTDPEIRALHTAAWSHTEDVVLELLRAARPSASLSPDDAALLLAVLDGIAVARAAEQSPRLSPTRARALITRTLTLLAP
ncbi:TetR family transcriptional regulator [Rathayibacter sp. VKM Ac-2804]|uniref:TetR/AcrR family transcriptional regulator n=1 Tax=unclassified Rathayibacter TaxID=2609250 RepID=UPI00132E954C|nr:MULTISPECIES: TetR/AcrR family transcriptional regulator [unclassified Rathayibacter]NRG40010.1 TetR/AcrR family transcriptional regulator [Rathayibacter sp. VKM Ac-2835]QHF23742.1 TetR family transcriptional regulator [Rathayibacter sp. VKM Ac-2804]